MDIRTLEKRDIAEMVVHLQQPQLHGLTGVDGERATELSADRLAEAVEEWCGDQTGSAHVLGDAGVIVGHVRIGWWWDALTPWVEVVITPERRNQGLGTEAAHWAMGHLFTNTPAHVVHASTPDWNETGTRFAERLGFERAGAMRRTGIRDGRYTDTIEFEMLRTRWEELDAADR